VLGDTNGARDIAFDVVVPNYGDDLVVGNLDLIDSATLFDYLIFTDASITSAGNTFVLDMDALELQDGSSALFTTDAYGLDFSRVSSGVNASLVGMGAFGGGDIWGSSSADTITGGAGNDLLTGGGGADVLDGGTAQEVRQIQFDGIADAAVDAPLMTLTMGTGGFVLTVNESAAPADIDPTDGTLDVLAGSGSDAVGAAFATLVNANLADINGVVGAFTDGTNDIPLLGASFSAGTDLLTFTFAPGADVLVTDAIVAAVPTDTGTLAASTDTAISEGGNGGADTFVYDAASDSTQAAMDQIISFDVDTISGVDDVIDLNALDLVHPSVFNGGSAFANYAAVAAAASIEFSNHNNGAYIGSDGVNAWVFADADHSGSLNANDLVVELVGVTAAGFDATNMAF